MSNSLFQVNPKNKKDFPFPLVFGLIAVIFFWFLYSYFSSVQAEKITTFYSTEKGHEQRMLELEIAKIEALKELEKAKRDAELRNAQVELHYNPFPR